MIQYIIYLFVLLVIKNMLDISRRHSGTSVPWGTFIIHTLNHNVRRTHTHTHAHAHI